MCMPGFLQQTTAQLGNKNLWLEYHGSQEKEWWSEATLLQVGMVYFMNV